MSVSLMEEFVEDAERFLPLPPMLLRVLRITRVLRLVRLIKASSMRVPTPLHVSPRLSSPLHVSSHA